MTTASGRQSSTLDPMAIIGEPADIKGTNGTLNN